MATSVDQAPKGDQWLHEIKWDGYRFICVIQDNKIRLYTRNKKDWTHYFSHIVKNIEKMKLTNAILDGEIVVLDKKQHSNFQLLQNAIKKQDSSETIYYLFDLLYYDGQDMRNWSLLERKDRLKKIIPASFENIRYCDHVIGHGNKIFEKARQMNLEGIVSKKISSSYISKRSSTWLKVKCLNLEEFIICGFTKPKGSRRYFGSLVLGIYKNKRLSYCGLVGTGFNEDTLKEISELLKKHHIVNSPFPKPPHIKNVTWVKPYLIAQVEFIEWTKEQVLRHPSFKGLRYDKSPSEVTQSRRLPMSKNKIQKSDLPITHPEKILYPKTKITKLQLGEYYQSIQEWILPHLKMRPLTLVRCPEGESKTCFYQKHLGQHTQSLHSIMIREKNGKGQYAYLDDLEGLISLVQMSVLEIHTWNCHVDKIEKPDLIIFDLDPAPDVAWKKVIQCAFHIKEQLEKINLQSFVKTTGGKGLHIFVPMKRIYTWDQLIDFSSAFVESLMLEKPDNYVATMSKAKRQGKIFIDYFRNHFGATSVAPYSTRVTPTATVSVPLRWDELSTRIQSDSFTVKNVLKRLSKLTEDPWEDFFKLKQTFKLTER